jgi:anti-sigma regulatory factor (Ser/Thr protein kinase)
VAPSFDADIEAAHSVRLTIPGQPEYVHLGRLALSGLARARALSADDLGDLKLALTEACSLRRPSTGGEESVEIRYELHDDRLVVEVFDEGEGFVVDGGSTSHDLPGWQLSEPVVGLEIIRALADELEVGRRANGDGSRLRFVKRLAD